LSSSVDANDKLNMNPDATYALTRGSKRRVPQVQAETSPATSNMPDAPPGYKSVPLWVLGIIGLIVLGVALVAANLLRSDTKPDPITTEPTSLAIDPVGVLVEPRFLDVRRVDDSSAQVMWEASGSAGVSYEVRVYRGTQQIGEVVKAELPPVNVSGLDFPTWTPCVKVTAVEIATQRIAESDRICAEGVGLGTTVAGNAVAGNTVAGNTVAGNTVAK
jgi:hypothetical protein